MKKTKIVATLGPASADPETVRALIHEGVNVFRFNLKHATTQWHEDHIALVKKIAKEEDAIVSTLIDLQGPEIRIETKLGQTIAIEKGQEATFALDFSDDPTVVKVPTKEVFETITKGEQVLLDDGKHEFIVKSVHKDRFIAIALRNNSIEHRKSMNLPGVDISLSPLHERDYEALDMGAKMQVPWVALSFVRSAADIQELREELEKRNYKAGIIAKIENRQALKNLNEIISATDAVMIARGDLGTENPIEEIAYWQKHIIALSRTLGKPVITATQMLESMIKNPRPTRAEATDVANAVFDGTDAVMLSGESASGDYPVEAVATMTRIITFSESKEIATPEIHTEEKMSQTSIITHAVKDILSQPKDFVIDVIVIFTESGRTARDLSRYRLLQPIFALTQTELICEQLALSYGVQPMMVVLPTKDTEATLAPAMSDLKKSGFLKTGHRVLFTHGDVWSVPGLTNTIVIKEVV